MDYIPSFLRENDDRFWSSTPLHYAVDNCHDSFLGFLAVMQSHEVPILPISWQSHLGGLGGGAQGTVSQSMQNITTNFAFKRPRCNKASPQRVFRSLISEIVILRSPSVRLHPNIVGLEGVCLEYEPSSDRIWPALVFEKANKGDLRRYWTEEVATGFSLQKRLRIFIQVAKVVTDLHAHNIIHGDLKPENLLVFDDDADEAGMPRLKVTDFGYACLGLTEDELVKIPRTHKWEAPEWSDREITVAFAKKADIFSLGLLCAWILFHGTPSSDSGANTAMMHLDSANELDWEAFLTTKRQGNLLNACDSFLQTCEDLRLRQGLEAFLSAALCIDKENRRLLLRELCVIADDSMIETQSEDLGNDGASIPSVADLSIRKYAIQLSRSEYHIRVAVMKALEDVASQKEPTSCHEKCQRNACFQLAILHAVGLGAQKDQDKSHKWLMDSQMQELDLLDEIAKLKIETESVPKESLYKQLWDQGHIRTVLFGELYRDRGGIEPALSLLRLELQQVEERLGIHSTVSTSLREVLFSLLREERHWEAAVEVGQQLLFALEETVGLEKEHIYSVKANMATPYRELRKFEKGDRILQEVLDWRTAHLGPEHEDTLTCMANLATSYLNQGLCQKAVQLYNAVMKIEIKLLGIEHTDTILTMSNLAMALTSLNDLNSAEKLLSTAAKSAIVAYGPTHQMTLRLRCNLAKLYTDQRRYSEALEHAMSAAEIANEYLGRNHHATLLARHHHGQCLYHLGRYNEAENILFSVWEARNITLGTENRTTIMVGRSLALVYSKVDRHEEARKLEEDLLRSSMDCLGPMHSETIMVMANLARTYEDLDLNDEAAKFNEMALANSEAGLGEKHELTLLAMSQLSGVRKRQKRLEESRILGEKALQNQMNTLGKDNPMTLATMVRLAILYGELEDSARVSQLREMILQGMQIVGPDLARSIGVSEGQFMA